MAGTFNSYGGSIFTFTDTDGHNMGSHHITYEAKAMIDLTDDRYIGKPFQVTFISETEIDDLSEGKVKRKPRGRAPRNYYD